MKTDSKLTVNTLKSVSKSCQFSQKKPKQNFQIRPPLPKFKITFILRLVLI